MSPATAMREILAHPGIWRGAELAPPALDCLSSGFAALDAELPGGGWPAGMLTEILLRREGIGELRLLLPALARLSMLGKQLLFIAPPYILYAPALAQAGIDPASVVIVRASPKEALWASEQALRANAAGAVLAWPRRARFADLRRLEVAAQAGQALALLFRPDAARAEATPAPLRLALQAEEDALAVHLIKRRGRPLARPLRLSLPAIVRRSPRNFHALDRCSPATPAARDIRCPIPA